VPSQAAPLIGNNSMAAQHMRNLVFITPTVVGVDACCCRYLAVVLGRLTGTGVIDHPVGGCPAVSLFRVEGHRQGSGGKG
jgi:hypothetical protein